MVAYNWRLPGIFPIPAQQAGEELQRIYDERGELVPRDIVDESRPETAVLHPCFEWKDDVAAEKYREQQARGICNSIVTVVKQEEKEPLQVRAVFHVQGAYHPAQVVVQRQDMYESLYQSAIRELESFQRKFSIISDYDALKEVFGAIETAIKKEQL